MRSPFVRGEVQKVIDESLAAIAGRTASDFSDQEVADAVNAIRGGNDGSRDGLRTAEFKQFLGSKDEIPGELPPENHDFFACRFVPAKPLPASVEDIVLAKKLRKVSAQIGFTRLSAAMPDLQGEYDLRAPSPLGREPIRNKGKMSLGIENRIAHRYVTQQFE